MRDWIFTILLLLFIIISCKEKNTNSGGDPNEPLNFKSLTAEHDTIEPGETTKIIVEATGYSLTFHWSATAGDILGKEHEVIYTATPCSLGNNIISCTISDGNNQSKTKTITIVVQ